LQSVNNLLKRISIFISIFPVIIFLLDRCANPISPQGGPKDIIPPKVTGCLPPNYSANFKGSEIQITFDEFFATKDPTSQITISPPELNNTEYRIKGKSFLIKLKDTLKANTTYSFNFGDAIADITENNILKDFYYVFSTGNYVDSLSLKGKVIDAFDLTPQKDITASLYFNNNDSLPLDSLPLHVKPYYIARTNDKGEFTLNNLKNVPLLLFALKDQNSNLVYDVKTEMIAFSDTLVHGYYLPPAAKDTVRKDTTKKSDTTHFNTFGYPFVTLRLFEKIDSTQKIEKAELVKDANVQLLFRFSNKKLVFEPLNFSPFPGWMKPESNRTNDTVLLWLKDIGKDTLVLKISNETGVIDTARIELVKQVRKRKSAKKEQTVPDKLSLSDNSWGGKLNQFRLPYELSFSYPLIRCDFSKILLIDGKDTVHPKMFFTDSLSRKIRFVYKFKEEKTYHLFIRDSVLFSYNGLSNDTIRRDFKTFSVKEFGNFLLNITGLDLSSTVIIQLLSEKNVLISQQTITGPGKVKFEFVSPGKFKVKAIYDKNKNGKWDTGDYRLKLQPEDISIFPKIVEIRANWDVEETWKL
jgi:hypothetical protein